MSVFSDKTFEGMDWLSQAVEPFKCELNDVLAALPDEYDVSAKEALACITKDSYSRDISVYQLMTKLVPDNKYSYAEREMLCKYFVFCASPTIEIDAETGEMVGFMKLIKKSSSLSLKDIKQLMKYMVNWHIATSECRAEAVSDLGALFFADPDHPFHSAKGIKSRLYYIGAYFTESVEQDTFKIRSVEAFKAFKDLILGYLLENKPENLGKIYRVIMMAKADKVIYDLEA